MGDRLFIPRKLWVDLREFGWGIREVTVLSGGGGTQPAPDSVGTEEIIDGSVQMVDLNDDVKDTMMTGDDRVTQDDLNRFEP
jgi:hypothetical protein